jgi:predicted amidophosphoribosyltransferase
MSHWLIDTGRQFRDGLLHLVLPACCHVCGDPLPPPKIDLCETCHDAIFGRQPLCCPHCAATVGPFAPPTDYCNLCRTASFAFEMVIRLGPYEGPLQEVVLRMKHRWNEGLAELVGQWWADVAGEQFASLGVDCVVPVPLHWQG